MLFGINQEKPANCDNLHNVQQPAPVPLVAFQFVHAFPHQPSAM